MRPGTDRHRAFLLRIWVREQDDALLSSLRDVESGETHVFATLEQLNDWLSRAMNDARSPTMTRQVDVNRPANPGDSDQHATSG